MTSVEDEPLISATTALNGATTPGEASGTERRKRRTRPVPPITFDEALTLGHAIQEHAAGQRVRRLTLFENMKREADSMASRAIITGSFQYGITVGSYKSEHLELTPDGATATSSDTPPPERFAAQFKLAIEKNEAFRKLYENFKGNRLPTASVLKDYVLSQGIDKDFANECVETFVVNAKFLGLLRTIAGAERLLTREHVLEDMDKFSLAVSQRVPQVIEGTVASDTVRVASVVDVQVRDSMSDTCFYIAPIGQPESEERQHSDLFMGSLVEPALQEFGMKLVRADQITDPGLISKQVIEYIVRAPLVIADLSYHNPNVFYELALRHAVRKPIVQLSRVADRLPFDVREFRTVQIDTTSIYTLVPRLDTYRTEIASQIRMSMESHDQGENPLTIFYPGFWSSEQ
ncbi:hypothetical protein GA0070607_6076 [Micromonospora coriariae]|uniref:Uncharacterized protein n=1 Tax=Micromonospora coriariae TaxID=285665 RepID=A0A1C4Y0Z0_9ACTN|nr:hypothetical protein [Micromonospora coriariae]SCF14395.1 hypothetical protein GA0070607_6076 [Micromonospora coriariae]